MLFEELQSLSLELWKSAQSKGVAPTTALLVLGPPGIGKSSCAKAIARGIADHTQRELVDLKENPSFNGEVSKVSLFYAADLSSCLPEDIGGIPKIVTEPICGTEMQVTTYAVQRWLAPFCVEGAIGVLCLDDLPAAAPAVAVAVRQLVLDRRVGQKKLSRGVLLFVTGNRRDDKAGASTLPSHFINSCTSYEIQPEGPPKVPGRRWLWEEWYRTTGGSPLVPAFLRWRGHEVFTRMPKDADSGGRFPTPRSWEFLGRQLEVTQRCGRLFETAMGLVGEGVAREFVSFAELFGGIGDPDQVLDRPLDIPHSCYDSVDKVRMILQILAERTAARLPDEGAEVATKFLRAAGFLTSGNREILALVFHHYRTKGGDLETLHKVARDTTDPHVVACRDYWLNDAAKKRDNRR